MTEEIFKPGLEGVIAGESAIGSVDETGLYYRGYNVTEMAEQVEFEEIIHLLLEGELPTSKQLEALKKDMDNYRPLHGVLLETIRNTPAEISTMDVLRTGVSIADHFSPVKGDDQAAWYQRSLYLTAQISGIIAARQRFLDQRDAVDPKPGLSHAAQLLYQMRAEEPQPEFTELIDLTLILYAEHGFNASTFAGRVCASTLSDLCSCIVTGIGTLKGNLHGGANEAAMEMLLQYKSAEEARNATLKAIENKKKIMGFGHRVYKKGDHRAKILERKMVDLARTQGDDRWIEIYMAVKDTMDSEKGIFPNVDYPCGLVYYLMQLPTDVYTPLFVASRVVGWAAHASEQHFNNRIIRPRARYNGPEKRSFVPMNQRK